MGRKSTVLSRVKNIGKSQYYSWPSASEAAAWVREAKGEAGVKDTRKLAPKLKFIYKPHFHGTTSAILVGLRQSKGKILANKEMERLGIVPFSGELWWGAGPRGISREHISGVSLDHYDILKNYAVGGSFSLAKERENIENHQRSLKETLEQIREARRESGANPEKALVIDYYLKPRLALLRNSIKLSDRRIEAFQKMSGADKVILEKQYPVIIASEPNIKQVFTEIDHDDVLTKEINLKTRKTTLFVPKDKVWETRTNLIKRGIVGAKVLPVEYLEQYQSLAEEQARGMGGTLILSPFFRDKSRILSTHRMLRGTELTEKEAERIAKREMEIRKRLTKKALKKA